MERLIILLMLVTVISCNKQVRIKTEVQESLVPVLYCPAPTIPSRPKLAVNNMTSVQRMIPGELAKHYQATIEQLIGYSKELELELQKYDTSNDAYNDLREQMNQKFIDDGVLQIEQKQEPEQQN